VRLTTDGEEQQVEMTFFLLGANRGVGGRDSCFSVPKGKNAARNGGDNYIKNKRKTTKGEGPHVLGKYESDLVIGGRGRASLLYKTLSGKRKGLEDSEPNGDCPLRRGKGEERLCDRGPTSISAILSEARDTAKRATKVGREVVCKQ